MHLSQHKLCTRKMELALEVKFNLDFHWVYTSMVANADRWKWRQIRISAVSISVRKKPYSNPETQSCQVGKQEAQRKQRPSSENGLEDSVGDRLARICIDKMSNARWLYNPDVAKLLLVAILHLVAVHREVEVGVLRYGGAEFLLRFQRHLVVAVPFEVHPALPVTLTRTAAFHGHASQDGRQEATPGIFHVRLVLLPVGGETLGAATGFCDGKVRIHIEPKLNRRPIEKTTCLAGPIRWYAHLYNSSACTQSTERNPLQKQALSVKGAQWFYEAGKEAFPGEILQIHLWHGDQKASQKVSHVFKGHHVQVIKRVHFLSM